MSTICGHFVNNNKIKSTDIYDMLKKMEHRGPDTHGVYLDGRLVKVDEVDELKENLSNESHIALGHSRLRIVGSEKMTQPYLSCDGKLALIHNGEIYNYQKLRTLLYKQHEIKTSSDSEIIVHLLEEVYQGDLLDATKKIIGLLDGTYSLAVTDGESIVVARDPIGKKPLYYIKNENITYFASEKKALWNGKDDPVRLNPGDILNIDNELFKVKNIDRNLTVINIKTGKKTLIMPKHLKIRAAEEVKETMVSLVFPHVEILHPETFQSVKPENIKSRKFKVNQKVKVVVLEGKVWLVD